MMLIIATSSRDKENRSTAATFISLPRVRRPALLHTCGTVQTTPASLGLCLNDWSMPQPRPQKRHTRPVFNTFRDRLVSPSESCLPPHNSSRVCFCQKRFTSWGTGNVRFRSFITKTTALTFASDHPFPISCVFPSTRKERGKSS